MKHVATQLKPEDGFLIGVDLDKSPDVLHKAYNDAQGITALFNVNILTHVNSIFGSQFNLENFKHIAFYNQLEKRIEMHLESLVEQEVIVDKESIFFKEGESIHTEYSYKYTLESFGELAKRAGLKQVRSWVDSQGYFSLQYFQLA